MPATLVDASRISVLGPLPQWSALTGTNMPISGLAVIAPTQAAVGVVVTVIAGRLSTALAPGVTVSGGGTNTLWIAGPAAQVNARLASLVYTAGSVGTDTVCITLVDELGRATARAVVALAVLPLAALGPDRETVAIRGGTLSLDTRHLDGLQLELHDANQGDSTATLILVNSELGANTSLAVTTDADGRPPRLAIAGRVELEGATSLGGGPATVALAANSVLHNQGRLTFLGSSAQVTGSGTLHNDGLVVVASDRGGTFSPVINVAVTGSGSIALGEGARVQLGGAVGAGQSIRFQAPTGTLSLTAPALMAGRIEGFRQSDRLELHGIRVDATDYAAYDGYGVLTLYDGARVAARLHFDGPHRLPEFRLEIATDRDADGGAVVALSVLPQAAMALASSEVYRFFDRGSGTQLLTAVAAERDALLTTRPDLAFEGVALHAAVAGPADPTTVSVFRFFDVVHGTHFYTASQAEKESLLESRPDLAFEPESTLIEHGTREPGDVPVFRFFDTDHGTHFYTASASERASILAERSDFRDEGIAFYAPGR